MSRPSSNFVKDLVRILTPNGIVENHRRKFQLGRLGVPDTARHFDAVASCRFELWPGFLRDKASPWVLVDVGANEGDFVDAVATLVQPSAVYAVEPQPSCHRLLQQKLGTVRNGTLIAKAVGDREGVVQFNVTRDNKLASVLTPDEDVASGYRDGAFDVAQQVEVPIVTLDQELQNVAEIGLLKFDVQGFEREVLRGSENTLRRTRAVLLEVNYVPHYEGGATFDDVYIMLRDAGFRLSGVSEPYGSGENGPLWADAMFIRD